MTAIGRLPLSRRSWTARFLETLGESNHNRPVAVHGHSAVLDTLAAEPARPLSPKNPNSSFGRSLSCLLEYLAVNARLYRSYRIASCTMLVLVFGWAVIPCLSVRADEPTGMDELRAMEEKIKQVAAKVIPAVVNVRVGSASGSGVIVDDQGHVLSAGHVIGRPNQTAVFTFPDGGKAQGITLGRHKLSDAGMLKITSEGDWPFVEVGISADVQQGAWVLAVGHPLGYQEGRPPVARAGRILRAEAIIIHTDCPLVAGDSGGPLVDLEGRVVGVNSRIGDSTNMNYHVPIDVFIKHWKRLAKGEAWEGGASGRDDSQIAAALGPVVENTVPSVVRVSCSGRDVALGTVAGADGWILTKASELADNIVCHTSDGRELEAVAARVNQEYDLAMLKVEATGMPTVRWSDSPEMAVGQWVASPSFDGQSPLVMGIIGVPRRRIPHASGVLGVTLAEADDGGRIIKTLAQSAAQRAGLRIDDVITHVDQEATPGRSGVLAAIKSHRPNDVIRLTVKRADKSIDVTARLSIIETPATKKRDMQNRSEIGVSKRRYDFPMVLQHDTVLRPNDCGGPLVDSSGRVIGLNIARGGRAETYAIPSDVLLTLLDGLMPGRKSLGESDQLSEGKLDSEQDLPAQSHPTRKPAAG